MRSKRTREDVAKALHWHALVYGISFLNPFMIVPQIYETWSTGKADGVSLPFFAVLIFLQSMFSMHGYFIRDKTVMVSNGLAAVSSAVAAALVVYFRI